MRSGGGARFHHRPRVGCAVAGDADADTDIQPAMTNFKSALQNWRSRSNCRRRAM